jgi:hypothetical protein
MAETGPGRERTDQTEKHPCCQSPPCVATAVAIGCNSVLRERAV